LEHTSGRPGVQSDQDAGVIVVYQVVGEHGEFLRQPDDAARLSRAGFMTNLGWLVNDDDERTAWVADWLAARAAV
jgi:hypothetical protein